jgi:hypothetical protein
MFKFNKNYFQNYSKIFKNSNIFFNILRKNFSKKLSYHKVFLDPFENYIEEVQPNTHTILKLNRDLIPVEIDTLDISSSELTVCEEFYDIDAHKIFDFTINHTKNSMTIEFKEDISSLNKKLHILFKVTNTNSLSIEIENCKNLKIHNSTNFKNIIQEDEMIALAQHFISPNAFNPLFNQISFTVFNSTVHFEKFDHKFVNKEYNYDFKLIKANVYIKKFFCYKMNINSKDSDMIIDKLFGYKSGTESDPYANNEVKIESSNSTIQIKNFINCGILKYDGSIGEDYPEINNNILINHFSSNSFIMKLTENDLININVYDMYDNSLIKVKGIEHHHDIVGDNINHETNKFNTNITLRIHPMLLFGINIYQHITQKFLGFLFFDKEGYSFCPTIILDINKELKKKDVIGYEMYTENKYIKYSFIALIILFFYNLFTTKENSLEYHSMFVHYQLFLKKKFEDYVEK